jgi:hypothetical protein
MTGGTIPRMTRRLILVLGLVLAIAAPLRAELKYTTRMELRPSTAPTAPVAVDPVLAMIGGTVSQMMVPGGSVEMTCVMGPHGIRLEWNKPMMGIPVGSAMIQREDGTTVVINPSDRTYWKLATQAVTDLFVEGSGPRVVTSRTGEFSEILGVRTERVIFQIRMPIPVPADVAVPGLPSEISLEGETWVAEQYKSYMTDAALRMPGLAALGMAKLAEQGLQMRQVLRSAMFGDREIESLVTKISEESVPAGLFQVPAGYKEVPAPGMGR